MTIHYTEEDFEIYYQKYVIRDNSGSPIENREEFWERKLRESEPELL